MFRRSLVFLSGLAVLAFAASAFAAAGPIGPLPPGPITTISASTGSLVSVALPKGAQGRGWRQKGVVDQKVLRQVGEGNVGGNVVIVFKAVGKGTTKVFYGLTRGEESKAYASATFVVSVK
jgi:hypothetical protein